MSKKDLIQKNYLKRHSTYVGTHQPIDIELLEKTVELITDNNSRPIKSALVSRVIERMPDHVLNQIANADQSDEDTKKKMDKALGRNQIVEMEQ